MSQILVEKYGGTSVNSIERIKAIAANVVSRQKRGFKMVVVVSAMGDTTDNLFAMMNQANPAPRQREQSLLLSTGEVITSALLAMAIQNLGSRATSLTGPQGGIHADSVHANAKITIIDTNRIKSLLDQNEIVVMAGYQGKVGDEVTVLGRGGSDASAVALAAALGAAHCHIYTDVKGVYTADPRIVKNASLLNCISFEEMIELASSGARVMMGRAVEIARKFGLDITVRSSFEESTGTLITREDVLEKIVITGVAAHPNVAMINIFGLHSNAHAILKTIASQQINIILLNLSRARQDVTNLSIVVHPQDVPAIKSALESLHKDDQIRDYTINTDVAQVSIVGSGIATHSGVASDMFDSLADAEIDILMSSTSEIKISAIIPTECADDAMRALHRTFKLNNVERNEMEANHE